MYAVEHGPRPLINRGVEYATFIQLWTAHILFLNGEEGVRDVFGLWLVVVEVTTSIWNLLGFVGLIVFIFVLIGVLLYRIFADLVTTTVIGMRLFQMSLKLA